MGTMRICGVLKAHRVLPAIGIRAWGAGAIPIHQKANNL